MTRVVVGHRAKALSARSMGDRSDVRILTTLSEAPGYARDLAVGLEMDLGLIERRLESLVAVGVLRSVRARVDVEPWYGLADPRAARWIIDRNTRPE